MPSDANFFKDKPPAPEDTVTDAHQARFDEMGLDKDELADQDIAPCWIDGGAS